MVKDNEEYLLELEAKIQILELENETLSAKAEENLLLNKAFEEINVYDDLNNLLLSTLESISVLLNIQFSGIFDLNDNHFVCISSYALFSSDDSINISLEVSEDVKSKISSHESCLLNHLDSTFSFIYPNTGFKADQALIIPVHSEIIKNRYFVFINDINEQNLANRIPLFEKIIRIISAKLEKNYYQNELKNLNEELEKKVESRTFELYNKIDEYATLNNEYKIINAELLKAKEKAEESDRLKTAFLQNMSHEIRTPMNAIMGFSGLLVKNYGNLQKLEKFSEIINQRCGDLLNIINDILDISKIESGQVDINLETCNIDELFSELKSFFTEHQKRIGKQHIKFDVECNCQQSIGEFLTDKVKLKQIFINLIGNAFKFTESGSIVYGCKLDKNKLLFYVSDSGIGIPFDKHEKVFERFAQLHQIANKNVGGTGLGLPIAKALTNLLGGQIWLESAIDKGTVFYFSIEYKKSQSINKTHMLINEFDDVNFLDKTILIVEDDFYNSEYLKEILSRAGLRIISTEFGNEAVKIASNQVIDLILMDIRLPDMSGYDAIQKIILLKPHLRIIAQTAYASFTEQQKALDAGCIDYISKPIARELLLSKINQLFIRKADI